MENKLIQYLSKFIALNEDEKNALANIVPIQIIEKGTILLKEGEYSNKCFFVLEGLVRQYYLVDGEEKNTAFYVEEQAINPMVNKASPFYLSCLEKTTLAIGDLNLEPSFFAQHPKFAALSRLFSEQTLSETQHQFAEFKIQSPTERYLHLLKEKPNLTQRVPQYQLASYLGIKPETLSRIRKKLAQ